MARGSDFSGELGMSADDLRAQRFHEARCLAAAGRGEEAGALFADCAAERPESAEFAAELLAAVAKKNNAEGASASLRLDEAELKQAMTRHDWPAVARLGPRLLAASGRRPALLLAMAAACEQLGYTAAQAVYLRAAVELSPENADLHRQAARIFARQGQFDEALTCWRKVASLTGEDREAGSTIAALTIAKCRRRAGLDPASEHSRPGAENSGNVGALPKVTRFIITHPEALAPTVAQPGGIPLTPIQQFEAAIRHQPAIPDLYLRLAQLYLDKGRDYDAERLLRKACATDNEPRVRQMWEEVTLLRYAERVAAAEREAQADGSPQAKEALAAAIQERGRTELEIYRGRVGRDPTSAPNQFELGRCLARIDKLPEACQHFEKALVDDAVRPRAALELARCQERMGDVPTALKFYRQAASPAAEPHRDAQIAALLGAARLALRIRLPRLAQRYLKRLLTLDADHREAKALLQQMVASPATAPNN
jgi:tetratricopeptide (TPR) repeat protein